MINIPPNKESMVGLIKLGKISKIRTAGNPDNARGIRERPNPAPEEVLPSTLYAYTTYRINKIE